MPKKKLLIKNIIVSFLNTFGKHSISMSVNFSTRFHCKALFLLTILNECQSLCSGILAVRRRLDTMPSKCQLNVLFLETSTLH